jgi:hypothetical protein
MTNLDLALRPAKPVRGDGHVQRLVLARAIRTLRKITRTTFNVTAFLSVFSLAGALTGKGQENWLPSLALVAITLTLIVVYVITLRVGRALSQRELNNMLARDQSDHVHRLPIVLFLRSFEATKAGMFQRIVLMLFTWLGTAEGGDREAIDASFTSFFEERLDDAVGDRCLFLAIGNKRASYGSAKILVEDAEWKQAFYTLAHSAALILMAPASSQSVLWELSQILASHDLLSKTFFLMPGGSKYSLMLNKSANARAWDEFVKLVQERYRLRIPPYLEEACSLRLRLDDHSWQRVGLKAFTRGLAKYVAGRDKVTNSEFDLDQLFSCAWSYRHG